MKKKKTKPKPGEVVIVKVGGKSYKTVIDRGGKQRFKINQLFNHLHKSGCVNLNRLGDEYRRGLFTQEEYLHFYMGLGYSVDGIAELSFFENLGIENPLW